MNNKKYVENIIEQEIQKIKLDQSITLLIHDEYQSIKESASDIRDTLDDLDFKERDKELDSGGSIASYASKLFVKYFEFLKEEYPEVRIEVTGGHDTYHKDYKSRHNFGEAVDFIVTHGKVSDVLKSLKTFKSRHSTDFKYLDEYTKPSKHATGKHFHIAYVGPESAYDKDKRAGGKGGVTKSKTINHWKGDAPDGTSLVDLTNLLATFAKKGKGGTSGEKLRFKLSNGEVTWKWRMTAVVRAPEMSDQKPNEDGIIPGAPETIDFYPTGKAHIYNAPGAADVEIEAKRSWLKRMGNILKLQGNFNLALAIPNLASKALTGKTLSSKLIDYSQNLANPNVITVYNTAGDIMGSLYPDKKYGLIFDISASPQFAVDEEGEVKYGHGKGMNIFQTVLDYVGIIPFYGDIVDLVNGLIYVIRGKYFEGFFSFIAIIPVVGSFIKFGVKGSFKVGTKSAKLFFKKISFKLLFKSTRKDAAETAAEAILQLKRAGLLDATDIKWLEKSGVFATMYRLLLKAEKFLLKYLPDSQKGTIKKAIFEGKTFITNMSNGMKLAVGGKYAAKFAKIIGKGGDKADDVKKGIDDILPGYAKSRKKWADTRWGKWTNADNLSTYQRLIRKISKFAVFKKPIYKMSQSLFKISARKRELVIKYIIKSTAKGYKARPQTLVALVQTMKPADVIEIIDPLRKTFDLDDAGKLIPKSTASKIVNIQGSPYVRNLNKQLTETLSKASDEMVENLVSKAATNGNTFLKADFNSFETFYRSNRLMSQQESFKKLVIASIGKKQFDIYYNELSEALSQELGFDVAQYGNENQSVIYYGMYKAMYLFGLGEKAKSARTDRMLSVQYGEGEQKLQLLYKLVPIVKSALDYSGLEKYMHIHDQVWTPLWNEVPGQTNDDKLKWARENIDDPEILKGVEDILNPDNIPDKIEKQDD